MPPVTLAPLATSCLAASPQPIAPDPPLPPQPHLLLGLKPGCRRQKRRGRRGTHLGWLLSKLASSWSPLARGAKLCSFIVRGWPCSPWLLTTPVLPTSYSQAHLSSRCCQHCQSCKSPLLCQPDYFMQRGIRVWTCSNVYKYRLFRNWVPVLWGSMC